MRLCRQSEFAKMIPEDIIQQPTDRWWYRSESVITDTPGMRELGMWTVDDGIEQSFSDIGELIGSCRFSDCSHGNEPDVQSGQHWKMVRCRKADGLII